MVGAGKMGLPLACAFASHGAEVVACDINAAVVDAINAGRCPIEEPGVRELLARGRAAGLLSASTDTAAAAAGSDVVVVIVPALLGDDRDVDTRPLEAASRDIARGLRPGTLVSYETTMPVGGTRRLLLPALESGGLRAGTDFQLAFSPERVKSGSALRKLSATPKIVGGIDAASSARAAAFYRQYLGTEVVEVGGLEAAEMVKLAGMVYRDVNIALANELAGYAEAAGVDLAALIPAVNTDGESALLSPGIGVGGHCTPVYPHFLIQDAARRGVSASLAERGRRINDRQAAHALDGLERDWGELRGRRALVLGLAFRPGVKEHTLSSAFLIGHELRARGADVRLHDPLFSDEELSSLGFQAGGFEPDPNEAWTPEVLVLNTAHPEYARLSWIRLRERGLQAVIDGRNFWDPATVRAAGLHYRGIGRPPAKSGRPRPLAVARPVLGEAEAEAAAAAVRSGWVMQGPQVEALEREFAAFVGAPFACAVSSGTAALHLALLALGVGPGDEVVTVSHSYVATANSVRFCGAQPVFVDVQPDTFNIDPLKVEAALTPRTRAILCVHQLGMPCNLEALVAIARGHGLQLVEDAACAAGSEIRWQGSWEPIGRPRGDLACFSFHPRKVITTGEGGMVTTSRPAWDRDVRRRRQHGLAASTAERHRAGGGESVHEVVGYNYRLTDIQAAVGREQLRRLPSIVARRRRLAQCYRERLAERVPAVRLTSEPDWARSNWQSLCVRLPAAVAPSVVARALGEQGIATRPAVSNAHQEPAWAGAGLRFPLPESERARRECLVLPLTDDLTPTDVDRVVDVLAAALRGVL